MTTKAQREWLVGLIDKYGKDARLVDVAQMERARIEKERGEQKQREQ